MAQIKSRKPYPSHRRRFSRRYLVASVVLLILVLAGLELTNTTHIFHKKTVPPTIPTSGQIPAAASQSGGTSQSSSSPPAPTPSPGAKSTSASGGSYSTQNLIAPYGVFISNHNPGSDGSPTTESSICSTTPGATCYIKVTKSDGTSTQLATQTAGTDGSTSWNWDAKTLTSGRWQVTAVASLGGQSKSTADPTALEVQ